MEIEFGFKEPYKYDKITPIEKEIFPVCPTCKGKLKNIPQRKTKCPHCGHFIFLKYSPSNPVRRLVNELENETIQQDWEKYQQNQYLLQRLSGYDITPEDLKELGLDTNNKAEIFKAIIPKYINRLQKVSQIGSLYFEIANDLYPRVIELREKFNEFSEEVIDDLGQREYNKHFPYGFIFKDYWEAVLDYIKTLSNEIDRLEKYQKARFEFYEVWTPPENSDSPVIDKYLNKKVWSVKEASESLSKLLTIQHKENLTEFRPLLLFDEKDTTDFYFPPFYLGCKATTVIHYT